MSEYEADWIKILASNREIRSFNGWIKWTRGDLQKAGQKMKQDKTNLKNGGCKATPTEVAADVLAGGRSD